MSDFSDFPEEPVTDAPENADPLTNEKLFIDSKNQPYKFFIPHDEPELTKLTKAIDENGGEVYNDDTIENFAKGPGYIKSIVPITSSLDQVKHWKHNFEYFHKPELIYESIRAGATLKFEEFRHEPFKDNDPPASSIQPSTINEQPTSPVEYTLSDAISRIKQDGVKRYGPKHSFSAQEDAFIVAMARKNPKSVDSKHFFEAIQERLPNHTKFSIRSRFRNKLKDEVKFYYRVKDNGELIKDGRGNYVIDTSGSQVGTKSSYSAKEDYLLCKNLSRQELGPLASNRNQLAVVSYTIKNFFNYMATKFPTHTSQSWRDRYRKFAVPRGILEYKTYYENSILMGQEPVVLSSFNEFVREQNKAQFDQFKLDLAEKHQELPVFVSPDEVNERETQEGEEDDEDMFMSPAGSPFPEDQLEEEPPSADESGNPGEAFVLMSDQSRRAPLKRPVLNMTPIPSPELRAQTMELIDNFSPGAPNRPSKRQRVYDPERPGINQGYFDAVPLKIEPMELKSIHTEQKKEPHEKEVEQEPEKVSEKEREQLVPQQEHERGQEPEEVPTLEVEQTQQPAAHPEADTQFSAPSDSYNSSVKISDSLEESIAFKRPEIDETVLSTMTRSEFLDKINEIASECKDTEDLVISLKTRLGISDALSSEAIMAVSGDLTVFTEYIRLYLETGENPPVGVPGIWTKEYDDIIWENDKEGLIKMVKLHNKKRCKHRRKFLAELKRNQTELESSQ